MGRAPCCDKANVKKGPWSPEEDAKLKDYIEKYGTGGNWIALPQKAGLKRCGKSCRLRWLNYLRPNIKHGEFSDEEDRLIYTLFASIGSRWSIIAAQLPGRTDNDIKNYWNTKLKKKLMGMVNSTFPKLTPSFLPQPAVPTLYKDCTTLSSFYEQPIPTPFKFSSPSSCLATQNSLFPSQESSVMGSTLYYPSMKDNHNLLVIGNELPSCSTSSDQKNYTQIISYGSSKEIKQEAEMGFQSYDIQCNGFDHENQRLLTDYGSNLIQKENGYFGESSLGYDLGDIKELICSGSNNEINGSNTNTLLNIDENKTQEKVAYYY